MPWNHCDVAFILDDEDCPACGVNKAAWTVQVDKTRNLVISLPRGWVELQLVDKAGLPRAGVPFEVHLANGTRKRGELDAEGVVKLTSLAPGPLDVRFDGVDLRHTRRHVQGDDGARAPGEVPIELTKAQCKTAGGVRHVFVHAPATVKVDLPLDTRFRSQAEATTWLLRSPMTVLVDGMAVAHGAFVGDQDRVVVQFSLPEGDHDVVVSSASGLGRVVYLRQRVRATRGGAPRPRGPARTAPAAKRWRASTRREPSV